MSSAKERNKDIINFHRLCKDLYKNIQRKIIKKYIYPDKIKTNSYNTINKSIKEEKEWKYYKSEESISEEEKIWDIFKDNVFLSKVHNCYESLEQIIESLDENEKNIQYLQNNIEIGEKKIQLLSQLNSQLNQFFKKNEEISNYTQNNNVNNTNTNTNSLNKIDNNENNIGGADVNVIGQLSLVKSLNILNDLQIMNSMNDANKQDNVLNNNKNIKSANTTTNTTITNNNNIILDNKIINNNIGTQKAKEKTDIINNEVNVQMPNTFDNKYENNQIPKLLNKKSKREKNDNQQYDNNNEPESVSEKNYSYKKKCISSNAYISNSQNQNVTSDIINNNNNNIPNKNNVSTSQNNEINENPKDANSNYDLNNTIELIENENNMKDSPQKNSEEKKESNESNCESSMEISCDKILKKAFSSICNQAQIQNDPIKKETIFEINNLLKKIPTINFNMKEKFEDPYIIGSYSHFKITHLMDYNPPIDILFKCKCIKSRDELKNIATDMLQNKLCIKYIEISFDYDKKNEIVKICNKCKIKLRNKSDLFIYINLFFVGVNLSTFINKEKSINRFLFSNNICDNKNKIIICLFFRRWRRKYKLFFIMPEFIDVIVQFYFNETETITLIIEKIFYDVFDGQINFENKNNNVHKDIDNIKEIKEFINEWYINNEDQKKLKNAIIATQELIMKNEFYSTFNNDEE